MAGMMVEAAAAEMRQVLTDLLELARDLREPAEYELGFGVGYVRGMADLICEFAGLRPAAGFQPLVAEAITGQVPVAEAVAEVFRRLPAESTWPALGENGRNAVGYLIGLVRQDIRQHQKGIDRFEARPGQPQGEADAVLAAMEAKQRYREGVHDFLCAMEGKQRYREGAPDFLRRISE